MKKRCVYCGSSNTSIEKEHVIPRCLYPKKDRHNHQLITVPTCRKCNASWSDDEAHFRNVINISGDANESAKELWNTTYRSFQKTDGKRRFTDLLDGLQIINHNGKERFIFYPGKDESVIRIVQKIIRGLSAYHKIENVIDNNRIRVVVPDYEIPEGILDVPVQHNESGVFRYRYIIINENNIQSGWWLEFFGRTIFVCAVLMHNQK